MSLGPTPWNGTKPAKIGSFTVSVWMILAAQSPDGEDTLVMGHETAGGDWPIDAVIFSGDQGEWEALAKAHGGRGGAEKELALKANTLAHQFYGAPAIPDDHPIIQNDTPYSGETEGESWYEWWEWVDAGGGVPRLQTRAVPLAG